MKENIQYFNQCKVFGLDLKPHIPDPRKINQKQAKKVLESYEDEKWIHYMKTLRKEFKSFVKKWCDDLS